jgi:hypothetical protein
MRGGGREHGGKHAEHRERHHRRARGGAHCDPLSHLCS